jgi:hypothetical protein
LSHDDVKDEKNTKTSRMNIGEEIHCTSLQSSLGTIKNDSVVKEHDNEHANYVDDDMEILHDDKQENSKDDRPAKNCS